MANSRQSALNTHHRVQLLDKIPAGITVIDREGRILYYNDYCARFVDRKPEYIGKDIRACHKNPESIKKIDRFLADLDGGHKEEIYYETERNGVKLGVRVSPFDLDGKRIGFIQYFALIR